MKDDGGDCEYWLWQMEHISGHLWYRYAQVVTTLIFFTDYGKKDMFPLRCMKLWTLKGNNSCKTYNLRNKVGNVVSWKHFTGLFLLTHTCNNKDIIFTRVLSFFYSGV
jgi:hypothetical protein